MAKGYRHIRVQMAIPGLATYGSGMTPVPSEPATTGPEAIGPTNPKAIWEPGPYLRAIPKLFEHLRVVLGDEVELLHDVHERITPSRRSTCARSWRSTICSSWRTLCHLRRKTTSG